MIYSLAGDDFRVWVSQQVKDRNDRVAEKRDLMIELDPDIAAAFGESANISSKFNFVKPGLQFLTLYDVSFVSDQG